MASGMEWISRFRIQTGPAARFLLMLALGLSHPLQAEPPTIPEDVRNAVRRAVEFKYTPSIVIGVMNADGPAYFAQGETALGNGNLPNEQTLFEIGSVTKVFTGTLLADMAEGGELGLDDPLQQYLPAGVTVPGRNGKVITLKHLATHTSGLPNLPSNHNPVRALNPYAGYTDEQMYAFLNEYILPRDPGALYEYSNYAVGLLGHVLARRAGREYDQLVIDRIANELQMPDTRLHLNPDQQARMATGYSGVADIPAFDMGSLAAAGSFISTAADLMRFLAANRGWLPSGLDPAMSIARETHAQTTTPGLSMGLGWFRQQLGTGTAFWHDGATIGFRAFVGFLRPGATAVVVLANSNFALDNIGFRLLDPSLTLNFIRAPTEVPLETLRRYVGRYALPGSDYFDVEIQRGHLVLRYSQDPDWPITVYPLTQTRFYTVAVIAVDAVFVTDELGHATALNWRQSGRTTTFPRTERPPELAIERDADGVRLRLSGEGDREYVIEVSTDLKQWSGLRTNTIWDSPLSDPHPTAEHRFYRAREAP
jgi:CubicO group peptidase (beta-lactamase class C family)